MSSSSPKSLVPTSSGASDRHLCHSGNKQGLIVSTPLFARQAVFPPLFHSVQSPSTMMTTAYVGRLPYTFPASNSSGTLARMVTPEQPRRMNPSCSFKGAGNKRGLETPLYTASASGPVLKRVKVCSPLDSSCDRSSVGTKESLEEKPDSLSVVSPVDSFPLWLASRKQTWRDSRFGTGPLVYIAMTLFRNPVVSPSWGIIISLLEESLLGVGAVRVDRIPSWSHATDGIPGERALRAQTPRDHQMAFQGMPRTRHASIKHGLTPGDIILSIDGWPVSTFRGMSRVATYLKQANSLHLVVLRAQNARLSMEDEMKQERPSWDKAVSDLAEKTHRRLMHRLRTDTTLVGLQSMLQIPVAGMPPAPDFPVYGRTLPPWGDHHPTSNLWQQNLVKKTVAPSPAWRNPFFRDCDGKPILYDDDDDTVDIFESLYSSEEKFVVPIPPSAFAQWLVDRKKTWRIKWTDQCLAHDMDVVTDVDNETVPVHRDFWTRQGFSSFDHWLAASTTTWKRSYTWNRERLRRIERACEEIVCLPSVGSPNNTMEQQLHRWLGVRKSQWRIERRKRKRRGLHKGASEASRGDPKSPTLQISGNLQSSFNHRHDTKAPPLMGEMMVIDALLEEQERRRTQTEAKTEAFDIAFVFDACLGAPDDVIAHCLTFLPRAQHGKLLCVSASTSAQLKRRDIVWRQLCPSHWILPRRPRKAWHELYITRIGQEAQVARKLSDDLVGKVNGILWKGDHVNKVEKLVCDAERKFGFDVNYVSGVVCERNALLNLAVISGRSKTARWLVEEKSADLETSDRGNFTPLMNAAWAGDRSLVRFFLSHGSDRSKVGTGHYTEALAPPDFQGLTAEGWARRKGHDDLANLIQLGL